MKALSYCLLLSFVLPTARAADPLQFEARIQKESLAEEAIDLLHCLSERLEIPWELGEGGRAAYRLKLEEKNGLIEGKWLTPEGEKPVHLGPGEAQTVCANLLPGAQAPSTTIPELASDLNASVSSPKTWAWAAAAGAIVLGGFFLWKSRQPDHRSLRME